MSKENRYGKPIKLVDDIFDYGDIINNIQTVYNKEYAEIQNTISSFQLKDSKDNIMNSAIKKSNSLGIYTPSRWETNSSVKYPGIGLSNKKRIKFKKYPSYNSY